MRQVENLIFLLGLGVGRVVVVVSHASSYSNSCRKVKNTRKVSLDAKIQRKASKEWP